MFSVTGKLLSQKGKDSSMNKQIVTTINNDIPLNIYYFKQPPKSYTFEMPKLRKWQEQLAKGKVLNLFAGKVKLNCNEVRVDIDLNAPADYHMDAYDFVKQWRGKPFDTVILDPPYNLRKAMEKYDGRFIHRFTRLKNALPSIMRVGGIVITYGYDTTGMGVRRGFVKEGVGMINHSGAHKDTLIVIERYLGTPELAVSDKAA